VIAVPEISVVAPLHNETGNVTPLAARICAALEKTGRSFEIILVDDQSSDDTWSRVKKICESNPRVKGIRHQRNAGQSAALWTGFQASQGNIIATLDGDLQNDPADLPRMLEELRDCDMVCGWRTKRADTFQRKVSSRIARKARQWMLGSSFADTGCNLRVFKRDIVEMLPSFNGLHRFMPVLAQNAGAVVKEIPVQHHPRVSGVSNYGIGNRLFRGIRDLIMVRWYMKRQIPRLATETFPSREGDDIGTAGSRRNPAPKRHEQELPLQR
jgi:dolichol-phosphate mannosyltransferase